MKIKLIVLIILMFCLTGCYSYTELGDLSIVNTLGIDYQNGKYQLIVNVVDGEIDDGALEEIYTTYFSNDKSLDEAFHNIYLKSNKKLYLSHIDLLVLTEDTINDNFIEIINNFLKNNEYRNNFNVVLLNNSSLNDFMNNKIPADDINSLLETNEKETGITKSKDFETIMKELLIDSNTYLPTITYENNEIILNGFTLIKNYKVYDKLSLKESILLNLLNDHIQKTYLNNCNIYDNETIITTDNNQITFRFVTNLMGSNNFKQKTKQDILNFLKKYQEDGYDILKLSEKIRKNHYSYYQKTNNLLSKLTYEMEFQITEKENYLQGDGFSETK